MNEWISVKDRLPEQRADNADCSISVLAYAPESREVFEYVGKAYYYFPSARWYDAPSDDRLGGITHWQPLPEPPKEAA